MPVLFSMFKNVCHDMTDTMTGRSVMVFQCHGHVTGMVVICFLCHCHMTGAVVMVFPSVFSMTMFCHGFCHEGGVIVCLSCCHGAVMVFVH